MMIMAHSVLHWNYRQALYRRIAKTKEWPILDHWGKVNSRLDKVEQTLCSFS